MLVLFWLSVIFVIYTYFGYPLCLYSLSLFRRQKTARDESYCPKVTLIITVHNEEKRIKDKIKNTLALDYPRGNMEILFASDASTDGTDEIVKSHESLRLVRSPERKGKESAQKRAIEQAAGEILVFSDVATMLDKNGLRKIVANFADETIGCVSSEDKFVDSDGNPSGEGAYVRYEMLLRRLESRVNTLVGLSGSFFAARMEVCRDWAEDLQSDFNTVLNSVKLGLRGVLDPEALGYYANIADEKKEFDRKVRTVLRGLSVMARNLGLLNPISYGLFSWQLFSHKVCRWLVPLALLSALMSNAVIIRQSWFFQTTMALQIIFYALALLYSKPAKPAPDQNRHGNRGARFLQVPYYFVSVNVSILVAWLKYLRGERATFWEPSRR